MPNNIALSILAVNRFVYLTANNRVYKLRDMQYSDRLKQAMEHAGINQTELSERAGIKQPSISHLLDGEKHAKGSQYTTRFARICGVSPDWLSDEIGEMVASTFTTTDEKMITALKLMQELPDYAIDSAVKSITEIAQLVAHGKKGGNGTDG